MPAIAHDELLPNTYYWARETSISRDLAESEVVLVSTVFGSAPEYWTVATMGSDQHREISDFTYLERLVSPLAP
jgi:hypothetical protein